LRIAKLASALPKNRAGDIFARQLLRAGTGVASNYRAACRARSHAEFIAKIGIVEEEADETVFWIELAADAGLVKRNRVAALAKEGKEILAIVTASRKTAKARGRFRQDQRNGSRAR
jgi:four helix bundle protein